MQLFTCTTMPSTNTTTLCRLVKMCCCYYKYPPDAEIILCYPRPFCNASARWFKGSCCNEFHNHRTLGRQCSIFLVWCVHSMVACCIQYFTRRTNTTFANFSFHWACFKHDMNEKKAAADKCRWKWLWQWGMGDVFIERVMWARKPCFLSLINILPPKLRKFHKAKSIADGMSQMATVAHPQND